MLFNIKRLEMGNNLKKCEGVSHFIKNKHLSLPRYSVGEYIIVS